MWCSWASSIYRSLMTHTWLAPTKKALRHDKYVKRDVYTYEKRCTYLWEQLLSPWWRTHDSHRQHRRRSGMTNMSKETCIYMKRDVYMWEHLCIFEDAHMPCTDNKEGTHILQMYQKRRIYIGKETYICENTRSCLMTHTWLVLLCKCRRFSGMTNMAKETYDAQNMLKKTCIYDTNFPRKSRSNMTIMAKETYGAPNMSKGTYMNENTCISFMHWQQWRRSQMSNVSKETYIYMKRDVYRWEHLYILDNAHISRTQLQIKQGTRIDKKVKKKICLQANRRTFFQEYVHSCFKP